MLKTPLEYLRCHGGRTLRTARSLEPRSESHDHTARKVEQKVSSGRTEQAIADFENAVGVSFVSRSSSFLQKNFTKSVFNDVCRPSLRARCLGLLPSTVLIGRHIRQDCCRFAGHSRMNFFGAGKILPARRRCSRVRLNPRCSHIVGPWTNPRHARSASLAHSRPRLLWQRRGPLIEIKSG
jgi:hypothetical protein